MGFGLDFVNKKKKKKKTQSLAHRIIAIAVTALSRIWQTVTIILGLEDA